MYQMNPFFRCQCRKIHVFPNFTLRVTCTCGKIHTMDSLSPLSE